MNIKTLRLSTGLTQRAFAEKYNIPLQTIKQWESASHSSSFRTPPDYVVNMLSRLISIDFGVNPMVSTTRIKSLIVAASHSKYNAAHWMRYLRKLYEGDEFKLTEAELKSLLDNNDLTMFQKTVLSRAANSSSATHAFISSLNKNAKTSMIDEIRRSHQNVE